MHQTRLIDLHQPQAGVTLENFDEQTYISSTTICPPVIWFIHQCFETPRARPQVFCSVQCLLVSASALLQTQQKTAQHTADFIRRVGIPQIASEAIKPMPADLSGSSDTASDTSSEVGRQKAAAACSGNGGGTTGGGCPLRLDDVLRFPWLSPLGFSLARCACKMRRQLSHTAVPANCMRCAGGWQLLTEYAKVGA